MQSQHMKKQRDTIFSQGHEHTQYVVESGLKSRSNSKSHTYFSRSSCSLSFHAVFKVNGVHDSSQFLRNSNIGSSLFLEIQSSLLEQKEAGKVWKLKNESASPVWSQNPTEGPRGCARRTRSPGQTGEPPSVVLKFF